MIKSKLTAAIGTAAITSSLLLPTSALASVPDYSANISSLVSYLQSQQAADGSITGFGGETAWAIMGLASVGIDPHTIQNGGVSVVDFLGNNPPSSVTGWERDLLAVTAAGENPFNFGGHNYVNQIQSTATSSQLGSTTSLNDDFFGILALISAGPSANQGIISDSVNFVISNQNSDGGWSYAVAGSSDPDDTAIGVQALQEAKNAGFSNAGLDTAIADGISYLTSSQQADGGWDAGFGTNAGSTAWSVLAVLGDDSAVTDGLDFIVSKQDGSGGIDGGFGADTYTSANSLIAFGQKAFPIGSFDGTYETPGDQSPPADNPTEQPVNNDNGQVLSATTQSGQVLAVTSLPETGIGSLQPLSDKISPADKGAFGYLLLLIGVIALGFGFGVKYLLARLQRYGQYEKRLYEKS